MINKLKQATSEMAGTSDIGMILAPDQFNQAQADDYIFHEDNEKTYFLIKSKKDEYCFTERALIHVDGESALSTKRNVKRYEYCYNPVQEGVLIETAGNIDRDVEIKFNLGNNRFDIDVTKSQLESLKDLYKVLYSMAMEQKLEAKGNTIRKEAFEQTLSRFSIEPRHDIKSEEIIKIIEHINCKLIDANTIKLKKDYSELFEKYINN